MGSIIFGLSMCCWALLWLILGGYVLNHSMDEDGCFSKWWPRTFAIIWLLYGVCMVSAALTITFSKDKPVEEKVVEKTK